MAGQRGRAPAPPAARSRCWAAPSGTRWVVCAQVTAAELVAADAVHGLGPGRAARAPGRLDGRPGVQACGPGSSAWGSRIRLARGPDPATRWSCCAIRPRTCWSRATSTMSLTVSWWWAGCPWRPGSWPAPRPWRLRFTAGTCPPPGAAATEIPPALAARMLGLCPLLVVSRAGLFAPPVDVPPGACPGDRLVAYLGRDPSSRPAARRAQERHSSGPGRPENGRH